MPLTPACEVYLGNMGIDVVDLRAGLREDDRDDAVGHRHGAVPVVHERDASARARAAAGEVGPSRRDTRQQDQNDQAKKYVPKSGRDQEKIIHGWGIQNG